MKILGKQFSNWWLLVVTPLLFVAIPSGLFLLVIAGHIGGAIFGPPALWEESWTDPPREEIIGRYVESEGRLVNGIRLSPATLTLLGDGSMIVSNLPYEFGETTCDLNGKGIWTGPRGDQRIDLNLVSDGSLGSCVSSSYSFLEITGGLKPHRLYWVIGDPDSGTGVWLKKER